MPQVLEPACRHRRRPRAGGPFEARVRGGFAAGVPHRAGQCGSFPARGPPAGLDERGNRADPVDAGKAQVHQVRPEGRLVRLCFGRAVQVPRGWECPSGGAFGAE